MLRQLASDSTHYVARSSHAVLIVWLTACGNVVTVKDDTASATGGAGSSNTAGAGGSEPAYPYPLEPGQFRRLPSIPAQFVVADPRRYLLWASIPALTPSYSDSVVAVDPWTLDVVTEIPLVGGDPHALAISDDGSTMWVSLREHQSIVKVDLESEPPHVVAEHPVDHLTLSSYLHGFAKGIAVLPNQPDSVVAVIDTEGFVLDAGIPRPESAFPGATLLFGPPGFLVGGSSTWSPSIYSISDEGIDTGASFWDSDPDFFPRGSGAYHDGIVYFANGSSFSLEDPTDPVLGGFVDIWHEDEPNRIASLADGRFMLGLVDKTLTATIWDTTDFQPRAPIQVSTYEDFDEIVDFVQLDDHTFAFTMRESINGSPDKYQLALFGNPYADVLVEGE